ncbi:MAG TPA: exo-alpha-sialidase [Telmatospirillum sp.]|nr:exo-alpha-sialidase [Telmatospirillum sp.]
MTVATSAWWGLCLVLFAVAAVAEEPSLATTTLPSLEAPTNHGPGLVELPFGGLLACWYAGTTEANADSRILCSASDDGGRTWSPSRIVVAAGDQAVGADAPNKSLGNVTLYHDRSGRLWMIYGVIERWDWPIIGNLCRNWLCGRVDAMISLDQGRTWSPSVRFDDQTGALPRAKPVSVGAAGDAIPLYLEGAETSFLRVFDLARAVPGSPPETGRIFRLAASSLIQPALLVQADGRVRAFLRDSRGRSIYTAVLDLASGRWTPAIATNLPNPGSAVDAFFDDKGAFILVYNPSNSDRSVLRLARSNDGLHFDPGCDIAVGQGEVAYPTVIRTADGDWHVVYSSDDKTRIRHVRFDAAWLDRCFERDNP